MDLHIEPRFRDRYKSGTRCTTWPWSWAGNDRSARPRNFSPKLGEAPKAWQDAHKAARLVARAIPLAITDTALEPELRQKKALLKDAIAKGLPKDTPLLTDPAFLSVAKWPAIRRTGRQSQASRDGEPAIPIGFAADFTTK